MIDATAAATEAPNVVTAAPPELVLTILSVGSVDGAAVFWVALVTDFLASIIVWI